MPCDLAGVELEFLSSGMKIQPIAGTVEQETDRESLATFKLHVKAAKHVLDNLVNREPVLVKASGNIVFRGWVSHGNVTVGQTTGTVSLKDPLKILDAGAIEQEFHKTSLKNVAEYIWEQVHDPEGVLSGPEFNTDSTTVKTQHKNQPVAESLGGPLFAVEDWLREKFPLTNGDGNMDFRGETPREAFAEVCQIWETKMFVKPDTGEFVLGFPEMDTNLYSAGAKNGVWKLTDINLPSRDDPFGAVYVKGQQPNVWNGPIENAPKRFVDDMNNVTPWAVASMDGYDGTPTALKYTKTGDKDLLEDIAKRHLMKQFRKFNSGTCTVDMLASPDGINDLGPLKVGDTIGIAENKDCGVPGGHFRIHGITHEIGGNAGWQTKFDVVGIPRQNITTKSWDYAPLDNSKNDRDPTDFLAMTMPIVNVAMLFGFDTDLYNAVNGTKQFLDAAKDEFDQTIEEYNDSVTSAEEKEEEDDEMLPPAGT